MTVGFLAWGTVILGVGAWLFATRLRRGAMLAPFSIALLLLVAIFGIRPLVLAAEQNWWFNGADVGDGAVLAAGVGFWAIAALVAGYATARLAMARKAPNDAIPTPDAVPRSLVRMSSAALLAAACTGAWFVAMILIGGGTSFLRQLAEGRSADVSRILDGVPVLISAVPVAGVVVLAVCRLRITAFRRLSTGEELWFWAAIALATVPPLALGNRRLLLPVALIALVAVARPKWDKRPPLFGLLLAGVAALVVAAIPFVRSAGSRSTSSDLLGALALYFNTNGIGETMRSFFVSYDTEMFSYIALVGPMLGDEIPYGLGRGTLGEALLQPLPAAISPWPTWSNNILTLVFGGGCGTVACPVPSVAGVLYFDTGLIGVAVGMALVGALMAAFEPAFLVARGWRLVALLTLAGFMPGIIRGNSVSQLWISANVLLVALILSLLLNLTRTRSRQLLMTPTQGATPAGA